MDMKDKFTTLCNQLSNNTVLISELWQEIEHHYSEKSRHYHTLEHLKNMFWELEPIKNSLSHYSSICFSVFYHDIIYNSTSKLNEEKSAEFAIKSLEKLNISATVIQEVEFQILATKKHLRSEKADTNFLLDADLAVLGQTEQNYNHYSNSIRKEYAIYPNFLYNSGRKKILHSFLEQDFIYKTEFFREKYELLARENIESELKLL